MGERLTDLSRFFDLTAETWDLYGQALVGSEYSPLGLASTYIGGSGIYEYNWGFAATQNQVIRRPGLGGSAGCLMSYVFAPSGASWFPLLWYLKGWVTFNPGDVVTFSYKTSVEGAGGPAWTRGSIRFENASEAEISSTVSAITAISGEATVTVSAVAPAGTVTASFLVHTFGSADGSSGIPDTARVLYDDVSFADNVAGPDYPTGPRGHVGPMSENIYHDISGQGIKARRFYFPDADLACDNRDWFCEYYYQPGWGRGPKVGRQVAINFDNVFAPPGGSQADIPPIYQIGDPGTLTWTEPEHGVLVVQWGTGSMEFEGNLYLLYYPTDPDFEGVDTIHMSVREHATDVLAEWDVRVHVGRRRELAEMVGPEIVVGSWERVSSLTWSANNPVGASAGIVGSTQLFDPFPEAINAEVTGVAVRGADLYAARRAAGTAAPNNALVFMLRGFRNRSWRDTVLAPEIVETVVNAADLAAAVTAGGAFATSAQLYLKGMCFSPGEDWLYLNLAANSFDRYGIYRVPIGADGLAAGSPERFIGDLQPFTNAAPVPGVAYDRLAVPYYAQQMCVGDDGAIYMTWQDKNNYESTGFILKWDPADDKVRVIAGAEHVLNGPFLRDGPADQALLWTPSGICYRDGVVYFNGNQDDYGPGYVGRLDLATMEVSWVASNMMTVPSNPDQVFDPDVVPPTDAYPADTVGVSDVWTGHGTNYIASNEFPQFPIRRDGYSGQMVADAHGNVWMDGGGVLQRIRVSDGLVTHIGTPDWWDERNGPTYAARFDGITALAIVDHGGAFTLGDDAGAGAGPRGAASVSTTTVRVSEVETDSIRTPPRAATAAARPAVAAGGAAHSMRHFGSFLDLDSFFEGSALTKWVQDATFDEDGNCYVIVQGNGNIGDTWSGVLVIRDDDSIDYLFDTFDPRWSFHGYPDFEPDTSDAHYTSAVASGDWPSGMLWRPRGPYGKAIWRSNPLLEQYELNDFSPTSGEPTSSSLFEPYGICIGADGELYVYSHTFPYEAVYRIDKQLGTIAEVCYFSYAPWAYDDINSHSDQLYMPFFGRASDGTFVHAFSTNDENDSFSTRGLVVYRMTGPGARPNDLPVAPGQTPLDTWPEDSSLDATGARSFEYIFGDPFGGCGWWGQIDMPGTDGRAMLPFGAQFNVDDDRFYWTEFGQYVRSVDHLGTNVQTHVDWTRNQFSEGVNEGPVAMMASGYLHGIGAYGSKLYVWFDTYERADILGVIDLSEPDPWVRHMAGNGMQAPFNRKGPAKHVGSGDTYWHAWAGPNDRVAVAYDPEQGTDYFIGIVRPGAIELQPNLDFDPGVYLEVWLYSWSIHGATATAAFAWPDAAFIPSGMQEGDVTIAALSCANPSATVTAPPGWTPAFPVTLTTSWMKTWFFYRVHQAGEAQSDYLQSWTLGLSTDVQMAWYVLRNVDPTEPVDGGWSTNNTTEDATTAADSDWSRPGKLLQFLWKNHSADYMTIGSGAPSDPWTGIHYSRGTTPTFPTVYEAWALNKDVGDGMFDMGDTAGPYVFDGAAAAAWVALGLRINAKSAE